MRPTLPTLYFIVALPSLACAASPRNGASLALQQLTASSDCEGGCRTASASGPLFMPDLFPDNALGEATEIGYPVPDRIGWTDQASPAPLMKRPLPADIADIPVLRIGSNCSQVEDRIVELGFNGAIETTHYLNWHSLSQLTAHRTLVEELNATAVLTSLYELSMFGEELILFGGSYAVWHGAIWYWVGTVQQFSWDLLVDVLCHTSRPMVSRFYANCMHGTGHGFLIRFTQKGYGKCSTLQGQVNMAGVALGDAACRSAPNFGMAQYCLHGFFHGVFESEFQMNRTTDALYPCERFEHLPHFCYLWGIWSVAQGVSPSTTDEEGDEIKPSYPMAYERWPLLKAAGRITHWCFRSPALTENALLGCIYGVSGAFLPVFDRLTAVRNTTAAFAVPSRAACTNATFLSMAPYYGLFFPPLCTLMFNAGPPMVYRSTTLVDWCSEFVDSNAISSMTQQRRWLACIHGSVGAPLFGASYMDNNARLYGENYDIATHRRDYCDQLLHVEWQPPTLRATAHQICIECPFVLQGSNRTWSLDAATFAHYFPSTPSWRAEFPE